MQLTPEQKTAVSSWVAAGDNLSAVQKKLTEQFKLSLTYRDVRFLVDDLELTLKDPAPKVDASDVSKAPPPMRSLWACQYAWTSSMGTQVPRSGSPTTRAPASRSAGINCSLMSKYASSGTAWNTHGSNT